jgi:hypothetical protein
MGAAVNVGTKGDAVRIDLPVGGQAEYLVPARIGEDGTIPLHKRMQTAKATNQLVTRPQIEMVCIGEDELGARFVQITRLQRLDVGQRADRRERRHLDGAVGGVKGTQTGGAVRLMHFETKSLGHRDPAKKSAPGRISLPAHSEL